MNTITTTIPNLDELFTELREALEAQHQAGYERAKYVWSTRSVDDTLAASETMLQATAQADEKVQALWSNLYQVAPAFADALQLLAAKDDLGDCLAPAYCPDPLTGMPCNACHAKAV